MILYDVRSRTEKLKIKTNETPTSVTGNRKCKKPIPNARQPKNRKSCLRSRNNVAQVAPAVSKAHPSASASQSGPINPIRREVRYGARWKDMIRQSFTGCVLSWINHTEALT